MTIPKPRPLRALRFLVAAGALIGLYVGLDSAAFWLFMRGSEWRSAHALWLGAPQAAVDAVDRASAPREATLPPSHRLAAFDFGLRMGIAAAIAAQTTQPGFSAEQRAAALREAQAFVDEGRLSRTLFAADASVLQSRDFGEGSRLPQRIEADEGGFAARIESSATVRHRHLYLLGMQVGRVVWAPKGMRDFLGEPHAEAIARHASLAGLPARLWEPLVHVPPGGSDTGRRARYEAAVEAVRHALWSSPPWR